MWFFFLLVYVTKGFLIYISECNFLFLFAATLLYFFMVLVDGNKDPLSHPPIGQGIIIFEVISNYLQFAVIKLYMIYMFDCYIFIGSGDANLDIFDYSDDINSQTSKRLF